MVKEKLLYYLSMQFQKWLNPDENLYELPLQKILIIKWDEIGDMAAALHVFELIKGSHSEAHITLLCKPFVKNLVAMNPFIDQIITEPKKVDYKEQKFDTVIELRGTSLTFKKIGANRPQVYLGRGAVRYRNKGNQKHETVTNYEIIAPILKPAKPPIAPKVYLSKAAEAEANAFAQGLPNPSYAVMHVLARKELRQWPMDRFAAVSHYLSEKYKLNTVLACAPEETKELTKYLSHFPQGTTIFSGKEGLLSFAALCKNATLFLGNESGPMQIAATYRNLNLIALYGPGVPTVFYPKGNNKKVLHYVLECNPCDQEKCVQPDNRCIDMITEAEVKIAVDELLG
jgi:ADP-heptose:LPS heptosyltransferase